MKNYLINQITANEGTYLISCRNVYNTSSGNIRLLLNLHNGKTRETVYLHVFGKGFRVDEPTQILLAALTGKTWADIRSNILVSTKSKHEQAASLERACKYEVKGKLRWRREDKIEWSGDIPDGKKDWSLYENFYAAYDLPAPIRDSFGDLVRPRLDAYQRKRASEARSAGSRKNRELYGEHISLYFPYFRDITQNIND